jgi:hypothetical protein
MMDKHKDGSKIIRTKLDDHKKLLSRADILAAIPGQGGIAQAANKLPMFTDDILATLPSNKGIAYAAQSLLEPKSFYHEETRLANERLSPIAIPHMENPIFETNRILNATIVSNEKRYEQDRIDSDLKHSQQMAVNKASLRSSRIGYMVTAFTSGLGTTFIGMVFNSPTTWTWGLILTTAYAVAASAYFIYKWWHRG